MLLAILLTAILLSALSPPVAATTNYEQDVEKLENSLDQIVERYTDGKNVSSDVETFYKVDWESSEYYEAIETAHPEKYSAIWQAIYGLETAIKEDKSPEAVENGTEAVKGALRAGLEALESGGGDTDEHVSGSAEEESTVDRIRADLDQAVKKYAEGENEEAKDLIMETYLSNFEGLEGDLIEKEPELATDLEKDFNAELLVLIDEEAPVEEVEAEVGEMKGKLDRVERLLAEDEGGAQVFGTETPQGDAAPSTPGPGIVGALVGLLAALALGRRIR